MEGRSNVQLMSSKWADAAVQVLTFERVNQDGPSHPSLQTFIKHFVHCTSLLHAVSLQYLRWDSKLENLEKHNFHRDKLGNDKQRFLRWRDRNTVWSRLGFNYYCQARKEAYHSNFPLAVIDGLTNEEVNILREESEQTVIVFTWLHALLVDRYQYGRMGVSPPIFSRTFQVLSDGMVGFMQARKLADTPFPFPHAQTIMVMLIFFAMSFPLLLVIHVESVWLVLLFNLMVTLSYFTVHEVARELEDPWRFEPNEIPVGALQHDFNERLLRIADVALLDLPFRSLQGLASTPAPPSPEAQKSEPQKIPAKGAPKKDGQANVVVVPESLTPVVSKLGEEEQAKEHQRTVTTGAGNAQVKVLQKYEKHENLLDSVPEDSKCGSSEAQEVVDSALSHPLKPSRPSLLSASLRNRRISAESTATSHSEAESLTSIWLED
eukprot:CAMPEP_0198232440 /NCGR_PEP_ID=MMETSP1445-20131203/115734_1 /TAXON_ID=36898 /ORGANISM="Pyramimonas sp., Strain CCMP2087" /LENGTH=434 /DNA_ID=CAMNT_0043913117 /DNA_START=487 /DNA_END=1788 /DNA_ORIENTATION=-